MAPSVGIIIYLSRIKIHRAVWCWVGDDAGDLGARFSKCARSGAPGGDPVYDQNSAPTLARRTRKDGAPTFVVVPTEEWGDRFTSQVKRRGRWRPRHTYTYTYPYRYIHFCPSERSSPRRNRERAAARTVGSSTARSRNMATISETGMLASPSKRPNISRSTGSI